MLRVKFRVRYFARDGKCVASVTLSLPCGDRSRYLHPLLKSKELTLFGTELEDTWGVYFPPLGYKLEDTSKEGAPPGWREKVKEVMAEDWETLERSIKNLISETFDTLRKIKSRNESPLALKPEDEEMMFEV